jgi:dTDP-glucose 4,6-dehydratase
MDYCRALESVMECREPAETYNVGAGIQVRNIDLVGAVAEILQDRFRESLELVQRFPRCPAALGRKIRECVVFVEDRLGHDVRYSMDSTKIGKELGFRCETSLRQGLEITVDWYLKNTQWWHAPG